MTALESLFEKYTRALETEMRALLSEGDPALEPYYGMLRYHMGWADESLAPAHADTGKRVRPMLCLLVAQANGCDWQRVLPAAAAVEFSHNFSLIHDDIQDSSPLRRGRRTLWKLWGTAQALNGGDALFTLAHIALKKLTALGVTAEVTLAAMGVLDEACLRLTQGQYLDLSFESRQQVGVDEYLNMIAAKTAALVAASTEIGALVGGAPAESMIHYHSFGHNLGLAFQIQDDILGIWGDEGETGKSAATDIQTRKKTLPVVYGLAQSEELRGLYAAGSQTLVNMPRVIELLDAVGARAYAHEQARAYSDEAMAHLEAAQPQGEAGMALRELATQLLSRVR